MGELESDLIKMLFITGVVFLLWVWTFWEDVQNSNEFNPDGLGQCSPETYTILDDTSGGVKCFSCPVCPVGEEPSPRCGITLVIKAAGDCVPCTLGTYSDEVDSASCRVCSDCGSRKVMSSCTAEKNTECRDCPWRHFEDDMTHTCKHCSICCGRSSAAELECIRSKKCKESCTRSTKIRKYFQRKIARSMNAPAYNSTLMEDLTTSVQQDNKKNSSQLEHLDSKDKSFSPIKIKRDINAKSRNDYKENTDSQTKIDSDWNELEELDFLEIPDFIENGQEQGDVLATDQGKDSSPLSPTKNNLNETNNHSVEKEERLSSQKSLGRNPIFQTTVKASLPAKAETQLGQLTPHNVAQNQAINETSFLSSFTGTITAVVFLGLIGLIVYIIHEKCVHKMHKGYKKLSGTSTPKQRQLQGDYPGDTSDNEDREFAVNEFETTNETHNQNEATTATALQDPNLAEIPPDLEDILVMSLDVPQNDKPCVAESNMYGWQKVGNAAGIPRCELRYYEHLGKHESPTKLLLEKLGSQGKTISYLIDVLQKPRLQLESVADTIIRHRVTRI